MSNSTIDLNFQDVQAWLEIDACIVTTILSLAFFFAPYNRWHKNMIVKLLLWIAAGPTINMLTHMNGMMQSLSIQGGSELYLIWVVFLVVAYSSSVTTTAYSIYTSEIERRAFETTEFFSNIYTALLIILNSQETRQIKFHIPLWILWSLNMFKMAYRIFGFRIASRRYGADNINLVANFMHYENGFLSAEEVPDARSMKGYNYLVVGEEKVKTTVKEPDYDPKLDKNDRKVVTIEKVWQCEGRLLCNDDELARRLKDTCLSFSLFKLLRRRFTNLQSPEASLVKTKQFVVDGLIGTKGDFRRTFGIIKVELQFLYDLFYTKYPISFCRGFSIQNILQLCVISLGIWVAVWGLHHNSYLRTNDRQLRGKDVDLAITYVIVILIICMESWEFINHVTSNWTKVLLTCNYVRNYKCRDKFYLDKLVRIVCMHQIWRPLQMHKIGQYSLLKNYKHTNWNILYRISFGFLGEKIENGVRKDWPTKLNIDVKEAIFNYLVSNQCRITNGEVSLQNNGVYDTLRWACDLAPAQKIMVWHIATEFIEVEFRQNKKDKKIVEIEKHITTNKEIATQLSRYCAYLLVFVPDLLSINGYVAKLFFIEIVSDAKKFFKDRKGRETKLYEEMKNAKLQQDTKRIVDLGIKLAQELKARVVDEANQWKLLAEFWSELILWLAPSDNAEAHRKKLVTGGEFITQLWVLLYHAGIHESSVQVNNENFHHSVKISNVDAAENV